MNYVHQAKLDRAGYSRMQPCRSDRALVEYLRRGTLVTPLLTFRDSLTEFPMQEQAISRVHRIGQVREVRVYRLLVKNSIEDSIVKVFRSRDGSYICLRLMTIQTQNSKREVIGGLLSLCAVPDVEEMRDWLA